MTALPMSQVRTDLAEIVNRVAFGGERVVINRSGKRVAALVSMDDLELLRQLEDAADLRDAKRALAEVRKKGSVPWAKVKAGKGR